MLIKPRRVATIFCLTVLCGMPSATGADEQIDARLDSLRLHHTWGEIAFDGGRLRQVKIDSVVRDQVFLQEVIGALHVRPAIYALADVQAVRELGSRRLQTRPTPYQSVPSLPVALGLELLIPGAGYFYAGESSQGWRVLLASVVVGAAAFSTGEDGAAAWIPLGSWLRLYSLGHLRNEVGARQELQRHRLHLLSRAVRPAAATPTIVAARWRF